MLWFTPLAAIAPTPDAISAPCNVVVHGGADGSCLSFQGLSSLPHGPLHGCLINIVIEDGFVIDLEFLRSNWRERSTLGVKEFVELLSVFLLEESSV